MVFQVRFDNPEGRGVVLRPCAKSSITIPTDVERKAVEQDAILNNVYKACDIMDPSVHQNLRKKFRRTSVVIFEPFSDLIPQAPNSACPVLLMKADVKPGIPLESTVFCTKSAMSGVRRVVDRRSLPAVASVVL